MATQAHIAVSGGFDPVHAGHIDYLESASKYGKVIVLLNSDEWLIKKKGYAFQEWKERRRIISSLKFIDDVVLAKDADGTVCESLKMLLQVKMFGKGGDRTIANTPEAEICQKLGIRMIFGLGGEKKQSSSALVANVQKSI